MKVQHATPQTSIYAQLPAIVKAYQLPDTRKAVSQILTTFLPFIAIWIVMYFLMDVSIGLTLLLGLINGFFMVRIFIIQHDCGHQSFLASKAANNVIGYICSFFSIIPYDYWAKSHNFHHGHNGMLWEHRDIGDIQLLTVDEFKAMGFWRKVRYILFRNAFVLFILGPIYYLFIQNRLPTIRLSGWERVRRTLRLHNLLLAGFYFLLAVFLGYKALLLIQLPILTFFAIIAVWFFYVQHQHEFTYKAWKGQWNYVMAAIKGSTYYKLPKVFHWLTGNIGYHHIHHLNSLVPNYWLARCHHDHSIFEQITEKITFAQSLRCMFNKLWDEQQQRMITWREYRRQYGRVLFGTKTQSTGAASPALAHSRNTEA